MEEGKRDPLTQDDLDRAVLAVASLLKVDEIVVVGSQALLVHRQDVDRALRQSVEFDVYPTDAARWARENEGLEASEQIFAILGEGSAFHRRRGFFVDGVDENTAMLPPDWLETAGVREVPSGFGSVVRAIAPSVTNIVSAKLHRGDPRDIEFASRCLRLGLTSHSDVLTAIRSTPSEPAIGASAENALRQASANKNGHTAATGAVGHDAVDVMLKRLRRRSGDQPG